MIELSGAAVRQVTQLRRHYERKRRPEAVHNLLRSLERASIRIDREPDKGLAAPRPYKEVAQAGRLWIKEGRYWIAYRLTDPPVIVAVIFDEADLPRRV